MKKLILPVLICTIHSLNGLLAQRQQLESPEFNERTGIRIERVQQYDNLEELHKVFIKAFTACYEQLTNKDLGVDDKAAFLERAWEDEKTDFIGQELNTYFIKAIDGSGKVVGFLSFYPETREDNTIYLSQLAVNPSKERIGIGSELIATVRKLKPDTRKLVLVARALNKKARQFYMGKQGFVISDYQHPRYPERYVGYEKNITE